MLMQMYNDPKYNDEKKNFIKELNDRLRVDKEEVRRALGGDDESKNVQSSDTSSESRTVQVSGETRDNKGRETCNDTTKSNGQEAAMYKKCLEDEKEFSKFVKLKSYDVNNNKEEYIEYKEN